VLTYAGAPENYPMLATPWGADPPVWRSEVASVSAAASPGRGRSPGG
jgi:hypothetical protein